MSPVTRPSMFGVSLAGQALVVALLLASWILCHLGDDPTGATPDLADWDVPRLVEHLRSCGLPFRLIANDKRGHFIAHSAYMTTTVKTWSELNSLFKCRERIDDWEGTLYCERLHRSATRDMLVEQWGDCCLEAGPFVCFGDRELLSQVRRALHLPSP